MTEREVSIIEAAYQVFMRYGVQRTSMNDIAQEAGIARQTLYNSFKNKDAILQATIRLFTERALSTIESGLEREADVGPRLDIVFTEIAVKPYEILHASHNGADIIQGMNKTSQSEIQASAEKFRAVIETILTPLSDRLGPAGMTPADLSDLIQKAAHAAKTQARNLDHLHRLLGTLKNLVLLTER